MNTFTIRIIKYLSCRGFDIHVDDQHKGWAHAEEMTRQLRKELHNVIPTSADAADETMGSVKVLSITKGKPGPGFDLWRGSEEYQGWLPLHQVSDWLRWELQHAIENPHATSATWHPWYSQGW